MYLIFIVSFFVVEVMSNSCFVLDLVNKCMDVNDLNKVWEVRPLRRLREDEAKEILEKVAKQVQPIMRKRKWRVKVLSEFRYEVFLLYLFMSVCIVFFFSEVTSFAKALLLIK